MANSDDLKTRDLGDLTVTFGTRPKMPRIERATDADRRQGRKLAAIHRAHLMDLSRVDRLLEAVKSGHAEPKALSDMVLSLDMAENFRAFGTLCGQECRVLTFHHDAEEHGMFPALEASGMPQLQAVVARLRAEHEVVHELLERLQRAAMTLMFEPGETEFQAAADIFEKLTEVVKSHFGYEESELEEAIGVYLKGI